MLQLFRLGSDDSDQRNISGSFGDLVFKFLTLIRRIAGAEPEHRTSIFPGGFNLENV